MRPVRVVIINKVLTHYRLCFFELLKGRLERMGINLVLIYGQPGVSDRKKGDCADLPWAVKVRNAIVRVGRREIYWQPCLSHLKGADLIIVEQANKLLLNYLILALRQLGLARLAFWGHGKDFQADGRYPISAFVKRRLATKVDWWFAYNRQSARVIRALGYPSERITDVQNAIDTARLVAAREGMALERLRAVRQELGIRGGNICLYAGGMYAEKRLGFLVEACRRIRSELPDFEMIFLGAGPDAPVVEEAARECAWIHYVGPRFGDDKVPYFMASKLLLMPGLVGLVVLDAFALETPLVTTAVRNHSPEIDYLRDGVNGLIVDDPDDPARYAAAVTRLLTDEAAREELVEGCRASRERYTVEQMAERFASGIGAALRALGRGAEFDRIDACGEGRHSR